MNKQAILNFIKANPSNTLSPYLETILGWTKGDIDMTDYDTIHGLVLAAKKGYRLTLEEIAQADILLTNISGHG